MTEQKYVSKTADRPLTWHRDPDCPRVSGVELVPAPKGRGLGSPCAYCANGISAQKLQQMGKQGDSA